MPDLDSVKILDYEDRFAPDFARLNRAWLEGFGLWEPADAIYLDTPRQSILEPGGKIFLAIDEGIVIGTCALLRISPAVVELAKLAVVREAQGRGIGRRLTLTAIDQARTMNAEKIILTTNSRLATAIQLYEVLGFQHIPLPTNLRYATADVYMELSLMPLEPVPR